MEQYDPRIDEYIGKKAAFAQPILKHLRQLMHSVSPQITETIKWGHPFFEYKGILANMAAFKEHCVFGFWGSTALNDPNGVLKHADERDAAGNFGRITKVSDLPDDAILKDFILQAIKIKDAGPEQKSEKKAVVPKAPKAPIEVPDYFAAALETKPKALATFQNFSPSNKREYLEWIVEAKTEATRQKRIETALEWMSEGKSRNWKYK
ncbi:YdeI/OmpD-associated family protein [Mucilaginibacter panaciglaebae]|uniref:YdeI family protein n=1 Tax=Mucilaginibacter panaciglaebae TaxID=502331 RepID=A0ABP7WMG0_9SPHI